MGRAVLTSQRGSGQEEPGPADQNRVHLQFQAEQEDICPEVGSRAELRALVFSRWT